MTVLSAIGRTPPVDNLIKRLYYVVKTLYHVLALLGKGEKSRGSREGERRVGSSSVDPAPSTSSKHYTRTAEKGANEHHVDA
jgi:hypothetical protein